MKYEIYLTICLPFDTCTGMFAFLKKLKSLRTDGARCPDTGEGLDFTWFRDVEHSVVNEYLDKAKNAQLGLERVYHILLKTGTATLDTERGSLTLNLKNRGAFVFVINDVQTGAQIESAIKLGDWSLRMSPTGTGLVNIMVVWNNQTYFLQGMPVDVSRRYL